MEIFIGAEGFEWDNANLNKNWEKHKVSHFECEEIFFNEPLVVAPDKVHSKEEPRWFALGKTHRGRRLLIVFTIRKSKIRIISARDMNKKEKECYK